MKQNSIASYLTRRHLPVHATPLRLLGVDYAHLPTADGGDLYVTWDGLHRLNHLLLENWREPAWFKAKRERLPGTSTVYRLPTKPLNGHSIDLVVKYCRVGEDVPLDTLTFSRFANAEFNSPYEEFSLVTDLRQSRAGQRILTHRPLAIYVPAERLQLWQTGRAEHRIAAKKARYRDVELDILRSYVLIYEWVKGVSADEALQLLPPADRNRILAQLTERVRGDLAKHGYLVADHKPAHIILRPQKSGGLLRTREGELAYALVDFELLALTSEHRREINASRRSNYLRRQRARFESNPAAAFPEHLKPVTILGVDYVFGHAESTQGWLWVVGHDPELFDYFLPERWRHTPGKKLSAIGETHYTLTKDNIHIVWKLSRVGERPEVDRANAKAKTILAYGFNSPFEEFAISLDLARNGIPTIYPRAIYMSGLESSRAAFYVKDRQRFRSHKMLVTENGVPLFRPDHNYLTIWGYWNGSAEMAEDRDDVHVRPMDLLQAATRDVIAKGQSDELMKRIRRQLHAAGYRDLRPIPSHVLLSLRHDQTLVLDADGAPALRLCNFELMQKHPVDLAKEADFPSADVRSPGGSSVTLSRETNKPRQPITSDSGLEFHLEEEIARQAHKTGETLAQTRRSGKRRQAKPPVKSKGTGRSRKR